MEIVETFASPQEEIAALRAKLHAAETRLRTLEGVVRCVPGVLWENWIEPNEAEGRVPFVSDQVVEMSGFTPGEWVATPDFWISVIHPDDRPKAMADQNLFEKGSSVARYRWVKKNGDILWIDAYTTLVRDDYGKPVAFRGVTMNATATVRAEEERSAALVREERLRMQESMLLELSTPLIPLDDHVVVMPLVGDLERSRAERATETLLEGVSRIGASVVILDITGVPKVDSEVASSLVQAAQSVALLGAEVILTGIRPEVARTLVMLGVDMGKIVTRSSLKAGIEHATKNRVRR